MSKNWKINVEHGRVVTTLTIIQILNIILCVVVKAHKAQFSTFMCCIESWDVSLPSMCLDHIIAHENTIYILPYPLNWLPCVSQNNVGHLELKNLSTNLFFWSTKWNIYNLGVCYILLERSWKYLSKGIVHPPSPPKKNRSYKTK